MGEKNCRVTLYKDDARLDNNKKMTIVTANNQFNEAHMNAYCGTQNRNDQKILML